MSESETTSMVNSPTSNSEFSYDLQLFIVSNDSASEQASKNIKNICKKHLSTNYNLQVTDIKQDSSSVIKNGILVTPTLKVVITPKDGPSMKPITIIGTLTNTERVLRALLINGF
ncbi:circadian clock KaiB family protein [Candidatus Halobeggiatoa sp. HSG11]|nr:circadian clock KaiB family protein [Candidatus Halobeggiatoa sp. HSG11]